MRWPWQPSAEERDAQISFSEWLTMFSWNGAAYGLQGGVTQTLGSPTEEIGGDYQGVVQRAYKGNGVVFACCVARMLLFAEARFQFRQLRNGRPGDLFGTPELGILEQPWPNGTSGDLLSRVMQDNDLAGNFYAYREFGRLWRMRPDWVRIILRSQSVPVDPAWAADAEVAGYAFYAGGYAESKRPTRVFLPEQVAHVALIPDPGAHYRGMSWLSPVLAEIMADESMTRHKQGFMDKGATPNLIVKAAPDITKANYDLLVKALKAKNSGVDNAYESLVLAGGSDPVVVGANFRQIDFKATQGAGETRIAAAARIPPALVGLSEGLQGSSLNAGNYSASRRNFADGTIRPYWRNMASSFASLVNVPGGAELWYDDRDIPYLRDDTRDAAQVMVAHANAINSLIQVGFDADAAVQAVAAEDYALLLGHHNGLPSVQQQPPGSSSNGASSGASAAPSGASALPGTLNGNGNNGGREAVALLGPFVGHDEEDEN
jgi:phage portal protein BeeE